MLFDVTRLASILIEGKIPTGVDRVSLAYLRHYRAQSRALIRHWQRWVTPDQTQSQRIFSALLGESSAPVATLKRNVARGHLRLPRMARHEILFNTGHSGLDHADYIRRVRRYGLKPFYFLHDLIPINYPEYCRVGEAELHRQRLLTMLKTGRGLIANSTDTATALHDYAQAQGLAAPPLLVAPVGTAKLPPPGAIPPQAKGRPYFVVIGTIEPRKNHLLLLQVWRRLVETSLRANLREQDIPLLVIIGRRGWDCDHVFHQIDRNPFLQGHVLEQPGCDDARLSSWLCHARALLFPSFVEGFGMPLEEALAHGVPVIASDLPVFHEMAGDVPDYLDPLNGLAWLAMIKDYSQPDSRTRAAQMARMEGFTAPDWARHFTLVDEFIQRLGGQADHAP